ncbi:MAG: class A beta-lactamase-related serine hydrolase [Candidatus Omnitrophica bacterium]|nr:class A beta-lactamase-related serine hydrolase [Candidatus Omnitrophota bacterium]
MKHKILFGHFIFLVLLFTLMLPAYSTLSAIQKKNRMYLNLKKQLRKELRTIGSNASFVVKDLSLPSLKISHKENERYPAASLIKLPILAVAFQAAAERKVALSQDVVIRKRDITGGSGILKTKRLPFKLSLTELLEIMIANSDNTATNKVIDILGSGYINRKFRTLGLRHTTLRRKMMDFSGRKKGIENYTSTSDIVTLLERIYNNKLVDSKSSNLALSFLRNQKVNDRIPLYLPGAVDIAHKTGLERGVVHDAGIIYTPKGDYIICVLTKKVKDYNRAKKFIAKLSLLTYNLYK